MRGWHAIMNLAQVSLMKLNQDRNAAKGGWADVCPHDLLKLLRREVVELEQAVAIWDAPTGMTLADASEDVIQECADVANFAAMIADASMH